MRRKTSYLSVIIFLSLTPLFSGCTAIHKFFNYQPTDSITRMQLNDGAWVTNQFRSTIIETRKNAKFRMFSEKKQLDLFAVRLKSKETYSQLDGKFVLVRESASEALKSRANCSDATIDQDLFCKASGFADFLDRPNLDAILVGKFSNSCGIVLALNMKDLEDPRKDELNMLFIGNTCRADLAAMEYNLVLQQVKVDVQLAILIPTGAIGTPRPQSRVNPVKATF